ncbi:MAG: TolC family protein [Bacteroidota bacterium]
MPLVRCLLLASLFVALCAPWTARAQDDVVARLVEEGLAQNLALQQRAFDLAQSRESLAEARGLFWPTVDLQARYSRAEGGRTFDIPVGDLLNPVYGTLNELLAAQGEPSAFPTIQNVSTPFLREQEQDTRLQIIQPLYQPQISRTVRLREQQMDIQRHGLDAYRQELILEIKTAYYDYVKAERAVAIYQSALDLVQEGARVNERLVAASTATHDALLRAQTEVLNVRQQVAEAERDRTLARSYVNFLLNRSLDTPLEMIESSDQVPALLGTSPFRFASAQVAAVDPVHAWQEQAVQARPELQQVESAVQASMAATALEQSAHLPGVSLVMDLGIEGETYQLNNGGSFYMGSLVLRWNLFNGFQTRSRVTQQRIQTQRLEAQRAELGQQIRLQVREAYDQAATAYQMAQQTAAQRVRTAASTYRLVARRYEEGLAPYVDLLDARTTLTTAELNLNITQTDLLTRLAELEYAIGPLPTP